MSGLFQMTETKHGRMAVLSNDTYVSRSLIEYGEWTEAEFDLLSQFLRPADNVIDVGANVGSLTIPFAKRVLPGTVYAFEPQPRIFQLLSTNCVLNEAMNTRLYNAGCAHKSGQIEIAEPAYGAPRNYAALKLGELANSVTTGRSRDENLMTRQVPIMRLDDVVQHKTIKLVKIDVEGMETQVLEGARRLINELRPVLYVENETPDGSPDLIKAVFDLGYEAYWHISPCFNPANFRGRKDNIFGKIVCVNMLCIARGKPYSIVGLPKIKSIDEHPRKIS
jgi:FkbM family methyltransferase